MTVSSRPSRRPGFPTLPYITFSISTPPLPWSAGWTPRVSMEAIGHASIQTTMNLYAGLFPGTHREAAKRMEANIDTAGEITCLSIKGEKRTPFTCTCGNALSC